MPTHLERGTQDESGCHFGIEWSAHAPGWQGIAADHGLARWAAVLCIADAPADLMPPRETEAYGAAGRPVYQPQSSQLAAARRVVLSFVPCARIAGH